MENEDELESPVSRKSESHPLYSHSKKNAKSSDSQKWGVIASFGT